MNMSIHEKPKCRCGLEVALKTASDGRKYFGCSKHVSSTQQCDFTRMLPSTTREGSLPTPTPSLSELNVDDQSGLLPSSTQTQGKIKRGFSEMEGRIVAAQTSSQKRTKIIQGVLTASQESTKLEPALSPSQRRTKLIEDALAGHSLSQSQTHEGPQQLEPICSNTPSPPLSNDLALVQPADLELVHQADVQAVRSEPTSKGEPLLSQQVPLHTISTTKIEDRDSAEDGDQQSGIPNPVISWVPQTPKRSEPEALPSLFTGLTSPSPSPIQNPKGKQKASDGSGDWTSNKSVGPDPVTVALESLPTEHSATKTQILRSLSEFFGYVSGLEKGHEVKDMKIKHLENEVQRLNERQEELKKLLKLYEQQYPAMIS